MHRAALVFALMARVAGSAAADPDPAWPAIDPADADTAPTAPPSAADEPFRAAVRQFAIDHKRMLGAWGTLHLDGTARTIRFAALRVVDGAWEWMADSAPTGAYVIEESPTRYWLVTYAWTEAGFHAWTSRPGIEPPWLALPDTEIAHRELHNHGGTHVAFGLRGGRLVVLSWDDSNDRAEPDFVSRDYHGCKPRCPALAGFRFTGTSLGVSGPARSIAALIEPAVTP